MSRGYSTSAIVLGSVKLGEADRIVTLFTPDRGRVPTVVKGIRKIRSRFGGRLEPFSHLDVRLHEGRSLHTLTGADTIKTYASVRDRTDCLKASLSFVNLLNRATPELEKRPRTFNLVKKFLEAMDSASGGDTGPATLLSLAAQLKFILLAGYLPRLSSCAVCSREGDFARFSAAAGGVLCPHCEGTSFKVKTATITTMRQLLEKPLDETLSLNADSRTEREIWQIIRETCRYHLGVDLKVEPWLQ